MEFRTNVFYPVLLVSWSVCFSIETFLHYLNQNNVEGPLCSVRITILTGIHSARIPVDRKCLTLLYRSKSNLNLPYLARRHCNNFLWVLRIPLFCTSQSGQKLKRAKDIYTGRCGVPFGFVCGVPSIRNGCLGLTALEPPNMA